MRKDELESKRPTLFLLGMIVALSMTLMAFEWRTEAKNYSIPDDLIMEDISIEIDLNDNFIIEQEQAVQEVQSQSKAQKPSIVKRVVSNSMPVMEIGSKAPILKRAIKLDTKDRKMERSLSSSNFKTPSVRDLRVHELPYLRSCGYIEDAIERFQCTQLEIKKYVVTKFRMPSTNEVPDMPPRVEVTFTIDSYGNIIDVEADQEYARALERELQRVVTSMPEMVPAAVNGERISVRFELPILLERK